MTSGSELSGSTRQARARGGENWEKVVRALSLTNYREGRDRSTEN
jgi:hypothetical protein